eukprot:scaffold2047_cov129-Cylindrotheca_fusiformis.AAC.22
MLGIASAVILTSALVPYYVVLTLSRASYVCSLTTSNLLPFQPSRQLSPSPFKLAANDDTDIVSDAEALLACWSYLKRRKRIGNWTKYERRQAMKASAKPHFFWEDEDEEVEIVVDEDDDEDLDYCDDEDWNPRRYSATSDEDNNPSTETWFGEFTSFPSGPTVSRRRRSISAKRTWQDPEFRKRWQESRWGEKRSNTTKEEQRRVEKKIRSLPRELWGSPELAELTEEEVATAIDSYVRARTKRRTSRKKTLQERKPAVKSEKETERRLPRDALFTRDQETLKEQQKLRSERAKKAYETRMKNKEKASPSPRPPPRPFIPARATPQDALVRIENDLNQGVVPTVDDILVIMKPMKLTKRKGLLKRILLETFGLRGKCVPTDFEELECEKVFVTSCSIQHLGDFVVHLLLKKQEGDRTMAK